jgi:hypothetical protein
VSDLVIPPPEVVRSIIFPKFMITDGYMAEVEGYSVIFGNTRLSIGFVIISFN